MSDERLHIALGVVFSQFKDKVLIAKRHDDVPQGGLWEFPGGKCETGEDVVRALKRELFEELNLSVDSCQPLISIDYDYPDQRVRLDVWSVSEWHGDICGREGQTIEWVPVSQLSQRRFPLANIKIIEVLQSV